MLSTACIIITSGMLYCGGNDFRPVNDIVDNRPSVQLVQGDVYVRGYTRGNGTYVQPHIRSAPDGNPYNNYSYGR